MQALLLPLIKDRLIAPQVRPLHLTDAAEVKVQTVAAWLPRSKLLHKLACVNGDVAHRVQDLMNLGLHNEADVGYIGVTFKHVNCSLHGSAHR